CECGCSSQLPKEKFAQRRTDFQSLSKPEQDAYVMANLISMDEGEATTSSRISLKYFESIKSHLLDKGLSTRVHGNTGKIPIRKTKMVIDQKVKETVRNFILNYGKTHGLPNLGKTKRANNTTIFLPTEMTYKSVYEDFLNSLEANNNLKQLKYRAFIKIWKQLTSQIGF
ncbi:18221_t:CDS:2, partial [Racocetra persica]